MKTVEKRKSLDMSWARPPSRSSSRPHSLFGGSDDHADSKSLSKDSTAANSAPGTPLRSPSPKPSALSKPKPGFTLNLKELAVRYLLRNVSSKD